MWKHVHESLPLPREQVPTKPTVLGRILHGGCLWCRQHCAQFTGMVITFPAKDSLLPLSASKQRGVEQEWDWEQKAFLFCCFLNFRWLTGKDLWMVPLEETKTFAISFSWNKWIASKLTSKAQVGFSFREKRCYFSFKIHWEKELSISYLSSLYSTCRPALKFVRAQWLQTHLGTNAGFGGKK